MNLEPVLIGVVVSFFDPCAAVFWEPWEVLGFNVVNYLSKEFKLAK